MDERSKRTQTNSILVRVGCIWSIESCSRLLGLHRSHLIRGHEKKLSLSIYEASNQPAGRSPVHLNPLTCNPLHLPLTSCSVPLFLLLSLLIFLTGIAFLDSHGEDQRANQPNDSRCDEWHLWC